MRLLALLLVAGCASVQPAAEDFIGDLAAGREARCAEAQAIYETLPDRTAADAALVVAACL